MMPPGPAQRLQGPIDERRAQACFTLESKIPLFRMVFEHELVPQGAGVKVIHRVTFSGLLTFLLGRMLVKQLNQGLPLTLAGLKRLAERGA